MSDLDRFKLSGLVARLGNTNQFIFCVNFNLPQDDIEGDQLDGLLATVTDCVESEFDLEIQAQNLLYKISATYQLVNDVTGDTRLWQGSFNPRTTNNIAILESRPYSGVLFKTEVKEAIQRDRVVDKLTAAGEDSSWTFSVLKSIILTFQARGSYT